MSRALLAGGAWLGRLDVMELDTGLAGGAPRVWRFLLDRASEEVVSLAALLDGEEQTRADRFVFPQDRARFIVGRATLRRLLSTQLGVPPKAVRFRYGAGGKPELPCGTLCFNLAHAGGLALVAFAPRPVGIDVEPRRAIAEARGIADQVFCAGERAFLSTVPESGRADAFLRLWTRKEALIKASGHGLGADLHALDVSAAAGLPWLDMRTRERTWRLWDVEIGPDHLAALCCLQG